MAVAATIEAGSRSTCSGVGEGGPPTLGHDCTLKFTEEKISMSATVAT